MVGDEIVVDGGMVRFMIEERNGPDVVAKCIDPGLLLPRANLTFWRQGNLIRERNSMLPTISSKVGFPCLSASQKMSLICQLIENKMLVEGCWQFRKGCSYHVLIGQVPVGSESNEVNMSKSLTIDTLCILEDWLVLSWAKVPS